MENQFNFVVIVSVVLLAIANGKFCLKFSKHKLNLEHLQISFQFYDSFKVFLLKFLTLKLIGIILFSWRRIQKETCQTSKMELFEKILNGFLK